MNGRVGSLFVMLVLLIGFNVNFILAENSTEEEVVNQFIEENILQDEVVVLDEVVEIREDDSNDSLPLEEVGQDNFSLGDSNESSLDFENVTLNEGNFSLDNVSREDCNVSENDSKGNFEYVDLDELVEKKNDTIEEEKPVLKELVKNGKVELEFRVLDGEDVDIEKKEMIKGEFEKRVLISSDEHFDDEIRVFSDLPSPAKEDDIIVTWENEDEVVLDLEYFDLDSDGLVDRISWVVPHLSAQYYTIEIVVRDGGNNENLNIVVNSPENGEPTSNPVKFNFSIDYINSSDVDCLLKIDGIDNGPIFSVGESFSDSEHLSEGNHNWTIECWDGEPSSSTIRDIETRTFIVQDLFELEMDDFFLKSQGVNGRVRANGGVVELKLIKNGVETFLTNLTDTDGEFLQDFNFAPAQFSSSGSYTLKAISYFYSQPAVIAKDFEIGTVDLSFDSSADENEDVDFNIDVDANFIITWDLYVGSSKITGGYDSQLITDDFNAGTYNVWLKNINGGDFNDINFGTLTISNGEDNTDPVIDLIYPEEGDIVTSNDITFKYKVDEDNGIANCTLRVFESNEDFDYVDEDEDLVFPLSSSDKNLAVNKDINDEETVKLRLVDFDEGYYAYDVTCYDDAGNKDWYLNYFSVNYGADDVQKASDAMDYSRQNEVEDLIDKMNSFLEKEDGFGLEERKVLDILGLSKDMSAWKKKVVQMDQDLKFNLKFMDEAKRAQRTQEIYDEIDEIEDKVVLDVKSTDSYEFSKNNIDSVLDEVIEKYMEASGTNIKSSDLRSLVNYNEGLQSGLDVSVEAWRLELEYLDGTREIVLVSKNIDASDNDLKILEVIPDKDDATFVTKAEDMGNNIYSVDVSDLEDGNLVYYFDKGFALKEVEKMDTILFGEGAVAGNIFTGMFIGIGDSISLGSFFWLPLFLFMGYFGFLGFERVRLEKWKKEPGVEEMVRLINETNGFVRENKVEAARENYSRMGEIYKVLPAKQRDYFYKEIRRLALAIDKKDVLGLIREYEAAKDSFRREDAMVLHQKINAIYRKLPKKFQEKVYRRLVKKEV